MIHFPSRMQRGNHRLIRFYCGLAIATGMLLVATGCQPTEPTKTPTENEEQEETMSKVRTFGEDVAFLKEHVETIVLGSGDAQVVLVPAYQGRVMTSTSAGADGTSYGWINYDQVAEGVNAEAQINVFGGEERFWLGPEGGQFSIFFAPGAKFDFSEWQTPPLIDTTLFPVVEQDENTATFEKAATIKNYSETEFAFTINRKIEMLDAAAAAESLDVELGELSLVGYRTTNKLTNTGDAAWNREDGLLSIWLLGMFKPSETTTVVIPFREGSEEELGPVVNDDYFGKVPSDRLKVGSNAMFFSGDGKFRSKIGVTPQRSIGICGSYDSKGQVLTICKYNQPPAEVTEYVNSMWEIQDEPFAGDAINSYNDGPAEPGAEPLGPFYELETSGPALALGPGESSIHLQDTYHIQGSPEQLDAISQKLFGVSLEENDSALK